MSKHNTIEFVSSVCTINIQSSEDILICYDHLLHALINSPAGSVAKYCAKHICVCVCVCVSVCVCLNRKLEVAKGKESGFARHLVADGLICKKIG